MNNSVDGVVESKTGNLDDDCASPSQLYEEEESEKIDETPSKLPKRVKAAKEKKRAKIIQEDGDRAFKDAICLLSNKSREVSSATIAAASARHEEVKEQADCKFQLKNSADKVEAVCMLFNDDGEDSKMYRNALKRKRFCKLLGEE